MSHFQRANRQRRMKRYVSALATTTSEGDVICFRGSTDNGVGLICMEGEVGDER